jgi:prevent-host-death family protein
MRAAVQINDHDTVTMVMSQEPKEITASQFKAKCLRLLDEVAETGETLIVTKHGKPVVRVEPLGPPEDLSGSVKINMTDEELIYFSMGPWEIEKDL